MKIGDSKDDWEEVDMPLPEEVDMPAVEEPLEESGEVSIQ